MREESNRKVAIVGLAVLAGFLAIAAVALLVRGNTNAPIRVIAPSDGDGSAANPLTVAGTPAPVGLIDLNTASQAALETLPGIGSARAKAIIDYRREHGPFTSIEQVIDVPGIGGGIYEKIRLLVTVGPT